MNLYLYLKFLDDFLIESGPCEGCSSRNKPHYQFTDLMGLNDPTMKPHKECHNENLPLMFELMIDTSKELVDFMYSLPQRQRCYEKDFLLPLSRRQSLHLATG